MKRNIIQAIYFLLIMLFAYAGVSKLIDHAVFVAQLIRFPLIAPLSAFISWAVPLSELMIVVLLLVPVTAKIGLYAASTIMVLFTLYLLTMVLLKTDLPCSCGGVIAKLSWKQHIVFNLFFIATSTMGILLTNKNSKIKLL